MELGANRTSRAAARTGGLIKPPLHRQSTNPRLSPDAYGESVNDLYAFLTCEPNAEVGAIHPKAMPVILRTREEIDIWMTASADEALKLQRPLADGSLKIVARGEKQDPPSVVEAGLRQSTLF